MPCRGGRGCCTAISLRAQDVHVLLEPRRCARILLGGRRSSAPRGRCRSCSRGQERVKTRGEAVARSRSTWALRNSSPLSECMAVSGNRNAASSARPSLVAAAPRSNAARPSHCVQAVRERGPRRSCRSCRPRRARPCRPACRRGAAGGSAAPGARGPSAPRIPPPLRRLRRRRASRGVLAEDALHRRRAHAQNLRRGRLVDMSKPCAAQPVESRRDHQGTGASCVPRRAGNAGTGLPRACTSSAPGVAVLRLPGQQPDGVLRSAP